MGVGPLFSYRGWIEDRGVQIPMTKCNYYLGFCRCLRTTGTFLLTCTKWMRRRSNKRELRWRVTKVRDMCIPSPNLRWRLIRASSCPIHTIYCGRAWESSRGFASGKKPRSFWNWSSLRNRDYIAGGEVVLSSKCDYVDMFIIATISVCCGS